MNFLNRCCRHPSHHLSFSNTSADQRTSSDYGLFPQGNTTKNGRSGPDPRAVFNRDRKRITLTCGLSGQGERPVRSRDETDTRRNIHIFPYQNVGIPSHKQYFMSDPSIAFDFKLSSQMKSCTGHDGGFSVSPRSNHN